MKAHGLAELHPVFPLMAQLEAELCSCRREVYCYVMQHDAAWLQKVEAHVRKEKAPRARRREGAGCGRGG